MRQVSHGLIFQFGGVKVVVVVVMLAFMLRMLNKSADKFTNRQTAEPISGDSEETLSVCLHPHFPDREK